MSPSRVPSFCLIGGYDGKLWPKMQSVRNEEEKLFWNFARSYLGIGWSDLLQIWNVDLRYLQQVWLNSGKWSQSYVGVKITFFVFLSIHSEGDAKASWAAWHTTVCLASFFCTLCIFQHNLRTHTPIKLKLGTREGLFKAHICTNFSWNLIKMYGVMSDYLRKKRSKVCHAYTINHWKELDETWHVGEVTIVGVPFVVWKESGKKTTEIWHKTQPVSKLRDWICQ